MLTQAHTHRHEVYNRDEDLIYEVDSMFFYCKFKDEQSHHIVITWVQKFAVSYQFEKLFRIQKFDRSKEQNTFFSIQLQHKLKKIKILSNTVFLNDMVQFCQ